MKYDDVNAYLRSAADVLGLASWDVVLSDKDIPDEECDAETVITEAQHAKVCFPKAFWSFTPEYQRLVIAHELCHCHLAGLIDLEKGLKATLSPDSFRMAEAWLSATEEHAVEAFARMLAPRLPLPRFKRPKP